MADPDFSGDAFLLRNRILGGSRPIRRPPAGARLHAGRADDRTAARQTALGEAPGRAAHPDRDAVLSSGNRRPPEPPVGSRRAPFGKRQRSDGVDRDAQLSARPRLRALPRKARARRAARRHPRHSDLDPGAPVERIPRPPRHVLVLHDHGFRSRPAPSRQAGRRARRVAAPVPGTDWFRDQQASPGQIRAERLGPRDEIRQEMGVSDQFVVGYAGLHGLAQRLETVLECAELLKARKDIAFVFVGSGPERDRLVRRQQEAGLTNVRFVANQPAQRVPSILAAFDAALIPLRKLDLFRGALPSKLFEAMASGVPLVLSVEGEAKDLVTAANAGLCVEPENPQAMAAAILRLVSDPALRRTFAESGRRYVVLNYDRRLIGQRVDRLLRGEAADYGREDPELPERQGGSA
ncbi:MAG: glycosyltransferase family 4 protein [Acidobacteria bacterium]|nr:glycosyltransferase family 4 protein [Acidobacteriota bacterium]